MQVAAVIAFALIWSAITGVFSLANVLFGVLIGLWALWVVRERMVASSALKRTVRALMLLGLFLFELVVSAVRVALVVLSPRLRAALEPGIIAFPLSARTDLEITILANMITLTPGTLSVDVSEDRKTLFVHAIDVPDKQALIRDIAEGFEKSIIEVFE